MTARRALPAGRPPDPRGDGLRAARRGQRASTRCGRPTAASCASAACRWPRSARSPSASSIGSGVVDCWTRNPARLAATFSTLDDLAPGRIILRHRGVVGPAGGQGRHRPPAPAHGDARGGRPWCGRCWPTRRSPSTASSCTSTASSSTTCTRSAGPKDVPIYIGATGMKMMELTGEIADGVRAQLPRVAGLQRDGLEHLADRRRAGRSLASTTSTGPQLVVCSLDEDRRQRPRQRPAARHPVPRPAAAHHEGVGRARVAARRDRARCSRGRPPTTRWWRRRSSCPTRSCR